jgi:hypothetical protein
VPSPPQGLINPIVSGCLRREPTILTLAGSGLGVRLIHRIHADGLIFWLPVKKLVRSNRFFSSVEVRTIGVAHRLFALPAGILDCVHIYSPVEEGPHGVPAFSAPMNDLDRVGGIVRRRMYVQIVMVITMRKRSVVGADSARGTMELFEGDSAERRRRRSGTVQIPVDRGLSQTTNHAQFDVVEASGWPCGIEQGLQLHIRLDRDVIRQRLRKPCRPLQNFLARSRVPE